MNGQTSAATQGAPQQSSQGDVNPYDRERFVGITCDSGLSTVKIAVQSSAESGGASCQVSDYILVQHGNLAVFGQVNNVRLEEIPGSNGQRGPMATVSLMSTLNLEKGIVSPGVSSRPNLGAHAYICHPSIVRYVAESKTRKDGKGPKVSVDFARLADNFNTPITMTPEMLFGRHMAILGTTGGGKSFSLARLVEEVAKHKSKTILFDASGEYGSLEKDVLQIYIGQHPAPPANFYEVVVPYYQLMENDLFAIFKPTGEGQAPKLRAAIKSLKLANLAPHIALDGLIIKANKVKTFYDQEYMNHVSVVERPDANFDVSKLVRQINNECVNPNRSAVETSYWGETNGLDLALVTPLVNRIQDITNSANLAPIFSPGEKPSLFEVIDRFLAHDDLRVLVISLQYLSFEHHTREIVANAAGRYLMQLARAERFQKLPLLICVDEAHQFLKEKMEDMGDYPLDSFALIAKEGRKYSLHICIATQRPRDLPESVLSQMGTLVVHRLINDKDRNIIERACGEADSSSLSSLPILAQGQAVLLGADFPAPLLVQVQAPIQPPISRSADFQKFWGGV